MNIRSMRVSRDELKQAARDEFARDPDGFVQRMECSLSNYIRTVDECFDELPVGTELELPL